MAQGKGIHTGITLKWSAELGLLSRTQSYRWALRSRSRELQQLAQATQGAEVRTNTGKQRRTKLCNRQGREVVVRMVHEERRSFAEVFGEVEKYLSVLAAGLLAQQLLDRAAASHTQTILAGKTSRFESKHEDASTEKRSRCLRLWSFIKPVPFSQRSAGINLGPVIKTDGFNAWRELAFWFQARTTDDSLSLLTMIMKP